MGVPGLWSILSPSARPIKLSTLNRKRLAVDASIWIYQFLKAVRDKEGNALRNSHVVGFFRRICKLLFHGILPVFVFDGGAPALKRETIAGRKRRREGRREDAVRTAGKLLAVQMVRRGEVEREERERERERRKREEEGEGEGGREERREEEEEVPDESQLVYREELGMTEQERMKNRTAGRFKKKDQYHLPELENDFGKLGAPDDPRVMSQEELEEYARQFHSGEDVNVYDFSAIDFDSTFFVSLPASDRYNILNAARLKSRLRMGYGKEQLDKMFPDRMAFSRFQIERVKERNELTQRLMNLNGMNGEEFNVNGRIAGEKGKEYVLVKNDGVEGGWALGVVSNKSEGVREKPIDVDRLVSSQVKEDEDEESEDGFEDVPIEGLNRLPKMPGLQRGGTSNEDLERRKDFYLRRREQAGLWGPVEEPAAKPKDNPSKKLADTEMDLLFVQQPGEDEDGVDDLFEDIMPTALGDAQEDDDLQRAIAMSLEQEEETDGQAQNKATMLNGPNINKPLEFNQNNAKVGRAFANAPNTRANDEIAGPFAGESDDEEDMQHLASGPRSFVRPEDLPAPRIPPDSSQNHGFDGPLPFQSLNLGTSLLGKKKKNKDEEGGFEKKNKNEEEAKPLPPWFSADLEQSVAAQKVIEKRDRDFAKEEAEKNRPFESSQPVLHRNPTNEVIDIDAPKARDDEVIEVESSNESEDEDEDVEMIDEQLVGDEVRIREKDSSIEVAGGRPVDIEVRMGDLADKVRAEPPETEMLKNDALPLDEGSPQKDVASVEDDDDEEIEWSESDVESEDERRKKARGTTKPAGGELQANGKSPSPEFENVDIPTTNGEDSAQPPSLGFENVDIPNISGQAQSLALEFGNVPMPDAQSDSYGPPIPSLPQGDTMEILADADYSDPEDEELMVQLAAEAEEHARFASSLTTHDHQYTAEDYERELKQLRNQQKKDRRDADEVTQIMITECQQLLKLFGLPYITAPMEAEAQCAELVSLGLVDGIVTDDSDIFLFGGTRVYKNMFNQAKFVECYLASDLEKEYSLTREKIIQVAHLLGSDYTEGLPHVGPVTAMEILSEFPSLADFRNWWEGIQRGLTTQQDTSNSFRRKFKKNATKLFLPHGFPDPRVDDAYLNPDVDNDPSEFAWGVPDLSALRSFLMATVGWGQERADEILLPVIKDMNRRETEGTQANITRFFGGTVGSGTVRARKGNGEGEASAAGVEGFAPRRRHEGKSKRMETALGKLHARAQGQERVDGEGAGAETNPAGGASAGAAAEKSKANGKTRTRKAAPKGKSKKRTAPAEGTEAADAEDGNGDGSGANVLSNPELDDGSEEEEYRPPKKAARKSTRGRGKKTKA
ncbi:DNA repair protein rad2 [Thelotrema lepadinum]|nr:DNA repair protein rad2 [Thelotrema lepadinum]